jgi:hypothetical protein
MGEPRHQSEPGIGTKHFSFETLKLGRATAAHMYQARARCAWVSCTFGKLHLCRIPSRSSFATARVSRALIPLPLVRLGCPRRMPVLAGSPNPFPPSPFGQGEKPEYVSHKLHGALRLRGLENCPRHAQELARLGARSRLQGRPGARRRRLARSADLGHRPARLRVAHHRRASGPRPPHEFQAGPSRQPETRAGWLCWDAAANASLPSISRCPQSRTNY